MTTKHPTCADRVEKELASRIEDLEILWPDHCFDDDSHEDLGSLNDYGLCFGYVRGEDDSPGYFQWQLSTGGPGDEFRFFVDPDMKLCKAEYWFLDWYDGASITIHEHHPNRQLLAEIWQGFFQDHARYTMDEANKE